MSAIKAVIFDLDGTLIDSMGVWLSVDKEFLTKRDIPVPEDLFEDIEGGNSFVEVAQYFKKKFRLKESLIEIMDEWTEMVFEHYANSVKIKPFVLEFLKLLKKSNIRIGIGTSNSKMLAETVLKANKVYDYFDAIVDGYSEVRGKPYPDIFLKVAGLLSIPNDECLVVEDVLVGVQAAKNADMKVFAIRDEHNKKEWDSIRDTADFAAQDFYELKKEFDRRYIKP
jgi:HAD superfamily hydrolase (TIGR01509 family)